MPDALPKLTRLQTGLPQATPACRMEGRPTRPQTAPLRRSAGMEERHARPSPPRLSLSGEIQRIRVLEACDYPLATSHFQRLPARESKHRLLAMPDSHLHGSPPLRRRHALHSSSQPRARLVPPRAGGITEFSVYSSQDTRDITDHQAAAFRAARAVGWSLRTRLDDLERTLEVQRLEQTAKEKAEQEARKQASAHASARILLHLRHLFVRTLRLNSQFMESQAQVIRRAEAASSLRPYTLLCVLARINWKQRDDQH